jgi:hypothetical protein
MEPDKVEAYQLVPPFKVYSQPVTVTLLVKGADIVVTVPGTYEAVEVVIVKVPAVGKVLPEIALPVPPADILERVSIAQTL